MKKISVETIIVPVEEEISLKPSVAPEDSVTDAIEDMLKNDLKRIAVTQGGQVVGMIRLEDALKKIGLDGGLKSKEKRSIVIQGRKIILDK